MLAGQKVPLHTHRLGPLFVGFGVFPLWDGGYGNPLTAQRSESSAANGQAFSNRQGGGGGVGEAWVSVSVPGFRCDLFTFAFLPGC